MRKILSLLIVIGLFALMVGMLNHFSTEVEAGARNATFMEWTWRGEKDAYFMRTGSGIVQGWTYDHPDFGDARFIYKPLSKFKNANHCGENAVRENLSWNPTNLHNVVDLQYKEVFWEIFSEGEMYLFCAYPMD